MDFNSVLKSLNTDISGDLSIGGDAAHRSYFDEFNSRTPLAVARVADPHDVSTVVRFAAETGTPLAVRAGGHGFLGHSTPDGGLVIDLERLNQVEVDPGTRTAWAGGGVVASDYTAEAASHGLATGFGDTGSVGVTGITLAGGIGLLHRKVGLSLDNVLAAEIVTADGELRHIDEENDPDLFWAIRGGGGNFGVVTRLRFRLHPIDDVLGGMLILPASAETMAGLVEVAQEASNDLSMIIATAVAPPLPFLPEELHGRLITLSLLAHAGEPMAAEREIQELRSLGSPLLDTIERVPYPSLFEADAPHPVSIAFRSTFSDGFTTGHANVAMDALGNSTAAMSYVQIRVLGGAVAAVPHAETAFAHRDRPMLVNVAAAFDDPGRRATHESWVGATSEKLQVGERGVYVNFHTDDSPDEVRRAYPGHWDRLIDIKTKYDANNLFSANHNITLQG